MQQGKPILNMAASFQAPEDGVHHQEAMPDVPGPDDLTSETELRREMIDDIPEKFRRHMLRARPIAIRPVPPRSWFAPEKRPPAQDNRFRLDARMCDDMTIPSAAIALSFDLSSNRPTH